MRPLIVFSECNTPEQGHGLPVDVWAIGMLSLQLLAGPQELPDVERMNFSSQITIDHYLERVFDVIFSSTPISSNGKDFIRCCLTYDNEARPTAMQAFKHGWLREPEDEFQLFKGLEKKILDSWEPRGIILPVIEDLAVESPESNIDHQTDNTRAVTTVSPHFRNSLQILALDKVCDIEPLSRDTQVANQSSQGTLRGDDTGLVLEDLLHPISSGGELAKKCGTECVEGTSLEWPKRHLF